MPLTIDILIILCLAVIVLQDIKYREISWVLIPLILAGFIYKAMEYKNILMTDVLLNISFIAIQLLLLTIYISIKNKKPVNIVNTYLGIGDILFFLVICVAFSPINFIAFYILSLVFTLAAIIIYNRFSGKQTKEIPLAGSMATVLIFLLITTEILPGMDLYNDGYLLNIINI